MIRRDFVKTGLAASVLGSASIAGANPARTANGGKPRMMFYHDGRHPLIYMYEPPMQKEEFEAGVDELAGTPVDALIFVSGTAARCCTTPRSASYGATTLRSGLT